jgi:branched-chain amino acid transport system permease protein
MLVLVAVAYVVLGDAAGERLATATFVRVVAVVALYLFVGNSGVVSFGHVGFMAIGAYAFAWLTVPEPLRQRIFPGLPPFLLQAATSPELALLVSAVLTAAIAVLVGLAILRLSGLAASMATFAILIVVHSIYASWDSVTGGLRSVIGIPRVITLSAAYGSAALSIVAAYAYQRTRWGLSLRASRDDHISAQASGVAVVSERLRGFVLSAGLAGFAGALLAGNVGSISIDGFWLELTFTLLVMLIVGGMGSLTGAVGGTLVVTGVLEFVRQMERGRDFFGIDFRFPAGSQQYALSILILLVLVVMPRGLFGWREPQCRSFSRRRE